MRRRFAAYALATCAVASLSVFAGSGLAAAKIRIQGSMPNGGCGAINTVKLTKPSKIAVLVSSTASENSVTYAQILNSAGKVLGQSAYNTSSGGTFGVQVCTTKDSENAASLHYAGLIGIGRPGPLSRTPGPAAQSGVAGVVATFVTAASGRGAIQVGSSQAWFTLKASHGRASVQVDDAARGVHLSATGLKAMSGVNHLTITGSGMTLTLTKLGLLEHVKFHARSFSANGYLIHGNFTVS
jgi:hypothetical protein